MNAYAACSWRSLYNRKCPAKYNERLTVQPNKDTPGSKIVQGGKCANCMMLESHAMGYTLDDCIMHGVQQAAAGSTPRQHVPLWFPMLSGRPLCTSRNSGGV